MKTNRKKLQKNLAQLFGLKKYVETELKYDQLKKKLLGLVVALRGKTKKKNQIYGSIQGHMIKINSFAFKKIGSK